MGGWVMDGNDCDRRGEMRRGEKRRGKERRDEKRRGKERRDEKRRGEMRRGEERRGEKRRGEERRAERAEGYRCLHPTPIHDWERVEIYDTLTSIISISTIYNRLKRG